jgi:multisubunit Na+/H+ antiporter MnhG subunit
MADRRDAPPDRSSRMQAGVIVGYIGLLLGLLAVMAQASEVEALPMNDAAAIVLLHMVGGFVLGWLIQPLLARLIGQ